MILTRIKIGWYLVTIIAAVPVILWARMYPLSIRFMATGQTLTSIGQMLSLTGITLFAISLILSARLPVYENLFGGMNKVYVAHHLIGGIAFLLLMAHPLFLAGNRMLLSMRAAFMFLIPIPVNWPVYFGIIALLSMMVLLIITYYLKLPYRYWKLTHKLLGIAFLFGALHAFYIPSDISLNQPLRIYVLSLCAIGLAMYTYRALLGRLLIRKHNYTVRAVYRVSPEVLELEMVPDGKSMDFTAGQFVFMAVKGKLFYGDYHPFSISSGPSQNELRLTVKSLGPFTRGLVSVAPGSKVAIEGPYGRFSYAALKNKYQIWVAGGIGITPFLSMARTFYGLDHRIDLVYAVHDLSEAVYSQELLMISRANPMFRVFLFDSVRYGHLDAAKLSQMCQGLAGKEIFLCGPPPMMASLRKQLRKSGVGDGNIHSEEFQIL